ncbi:site-specific integrase [Tenacibaculum agarivorans]|uniref:site-specific integrase n=1 Tax=Tenacibaculum agarivorans TaxID=1908389 RepID=UPI00094BB7C4|nr:site-specific integrase [Tenacibaculum agarivorans]
MPTSSYRIKTDSKFNSIYLRFKEGKLDLEVSTKIKVPRGKWSAKLQKINHTDEINYKELNKKLKQLKVHVENQYSTDSLEGIIIDNKWLKSNINNFLNRVTLNKSLDEKLFFTAFFQSFIDSAKKRIKHPKNPIKKKTVQHYQTTKNKIEAYEKYHGKHLKLEDINIKFHTDFIEYLEIEQYLNPNTIGGYIDVIKHVCNKALLKGYSINSEFKSSEFYTPSNETLDPYLTLEEIHKINMFNFSQDYLDNARDWLIISVWTGLRVSDLLTLTKTNLDNDFIKKDTLKTKFPVIIPLHNQVKKILNKRNGNFPRKISNQKYNNYIKEVCKEAGITNIIKGGKICAQIKVKNGVKETVYRKTIGKYPKYELITSHIGRRSFATNHYGKLDTLTLMKITGHKTEKQFLDYIKITPKEYAIKLKAYWENINFNDFINS